MNEKKSIEDICFHIADLTEKDFEEAELIIRNQARYHHPLKMGTTGRMAELAEYNTKVIKALRGLYDIIQARKQEENPQ